MKTRLREEKLSAKSQCLKFSECKFLFCSFIAVLRVSCDPQLHSCHFVNYFAASSFNAQQVNDVWNYFCPVSYMRGDETNGKFYKLKSYLNLPELQEKGYDTLTHICQST